MNLTSYNYTFESIPAFHITNKSQYTINNGFVCIKCRQGR